LFLGQVRIIEQDYLFRVFSLMLNCIDENGWEDGQIPMAPMMENLSSLEPQCILESVFRWFFEQKNDLSSSALPLGMYGILNVSFNTLFHRATQVILLLCTL